MGMSTEVWWRVVCDAYPEDSGKSKEYILWEYTDNTATPESIRDDFRWYCTTYSPGRIVRIEKKVLEITSTEWENAE